jgi:hypothetical protein
MTAAWTCGNCGAVEDRKGGARIDWVCHHCGKLLCKDCRDTIPDGGFARAGAVPAQARHCADCYRRHHRRRGVRS